MAQPAAESRSARVQRVLSRAPGVRDASVSLLTNSAQDPQSKMPELKACAVAIEPLGDDERLIELRGSGEVAHRYVAAARAWDGKRS